MPWNIQIGKKGEDMAAEYLQKKAYSIIERNYFYDKAEVDIIALKNNMLVAVEVKLRSSDAFGAPQNFVNQKKKKLLIKAMDFYAESNNLDYEIRFDIIAILINKNRFKLHHIENAFYQF